MATPRGSKDAIYAALGKVKYMAAKVVNFPARVMNRIERGMKAVDQSRRDRNARMIAEQKERMY